MYSRSPQTTPNPESHPRLHLRKPRHSRRHLPPPIKLLVRNPQNNSSHPQLGRKESRPPIPRRLVVVRNHNIRHPHRILRWRRNPHHGRRYVRRLLYRRLHRARPRLRSIGTLRTQLPNPRRRHNHQNALHLCRHQRRHNPPHRHTRAQFPAGQNNRNSRHNPIQRYITRPQTRPRARRVQSHNPANHAAFQGGDIGLHIAAVVRPGNRLFIVSG